MSNVLESIGAGVLTGMSVLTLSYLAGLGWRKGRGNSTTVNVINTRSVEVNTPHTNLVIDSNTTTDNQENAKREHRDE